MGEVGAPREPQMPVGRRSLTDLPPPNVIYDHPGTVRENIKFLADCDVPGLVDLAMGLLADLEELRGLGGHEARRPRARTPRPSAGLFRSS